MSDERRKRIEDAAEREFFYDTQEDLVGPVQLKWITNFTIQQINAALESACNATCPYCARYGLPDFKDGGYVGHYITETAVRDCEATAIRALKIEEKS